MLSWERFMLFNVKKHNKHLLSEVGVILVFQCLSGGEPKINTDYEVWEHDGHMKKKEIWCWGGQNRGFLWFPRFCENLHSNLLFLWPLEHRVSMWLLKICMSCCEIWFAPSNFHRQPDNWDNQLFLYERLNLKILTKSVRFLFKLFII